MGKCEVYQMEGEWGRNQWLLKPSKTNAVEENKVSLQKYMRMKLLGKSEKQIVAI